MSVLESLYNDTFTTRRSSTDSSTSTDSVATVLTSISCLIRPVTDRNQLFNPGNWGKEFRCWTQTGLDILENDALIASSTTYSIAYISQYDDLENNEESHLELRIYTK